MFRLICPSIVRVVVSRNICQHTTENQLKRVVLTKSPPKPVILLDHYRCFRTTECRRTPKLILLFIRPIVSALSGRLFRRWWQKKDEAERLILFNRNKSRILIVMGLYFSSLVVYYFYNIEETPITRRRRFMAFTKDQLSEITKASSSAIVEGYEAIDRYHPYVKRVVDATQRIVRANSDIEQFNGVEWKVSIFDEPGSLNTMVDSHGHIFVFKEMIEHCATDDELGVVLCHEMAHAILNHVAEKLSKAWLIGFFTAPLLFLIWAVSPTDISAAIFTYLQNIVMNLAVHFPYERVVESEADTVGLRLAAKACIDVRQAVSFFKRMEDVEKKIVGLPAEAKLPSVTEYLSTHPTNEKRWKSMEKQLESALLLRDECKCAPLEALPKELSKNLILEKQRDQAIHIRII